MRCFLIILSVTTSLFYSYMYSRCRVSGQSFEDPNKYYEKMTLDATLRGSFNLSNCVKEMMTCFELLRPDIICERVKYHDTACGPMRALCHDYYGNYDSYGYRLDLYEDYCREDDKQHWT